MLRKILVVIVLLVVALVIVIALQPSEYRVTRGITISAPPAAVFERVNDFHQWAAWSPWEKLDPAMKKSYEGGPGNGAIYTWEGNKQVGAGRMLIVESKPADLIRIKLDFLQPFQATDITEFTFKPAGEQTAVTWTMAGTNNFISKAMGLFMNMDKMIGGDFERGLANMKSTVEAASKH